MGSLILATGINPPFNTSGNDVVMNKEDQIKTTLESIVGRDSIWVRDEYSTRYYEIAPVSTEMIQAVVKFANRNNITVFHGKGSHLSQPQSISNHHAILLHLSKMKKITAVNETSRYAIVEPGVSHQELTEYLNAHYPLLQHCLGPDSPGDTILATALECGTNSLSTLYGNTDDMVQGLEVVLPDGSISKIGSCCISRLWFTNHALPDLRGLFLNWHGTTGIITKLSLRLFCRFDFNDIVIYTFKDHQMIPEVIEKVTHLEMADMVTIIGKELPSYLEGMIIIALHLSGTTREVLDLKKEVFKNLFKNNKKMMFKDCLSKDMRNAIFTGADSLDKKDKAYIDSFDCLLPLEIIPSAWQQGIKIIHTHPCKYLFDFFVEDHGHRIFGRFTYVYYGSPGSAASLSSPASSIRKELQVMILDLGGIPRDLSEGNQKDPVQRMDSVTAELANKIRLVLDANRILNPDKWRIFHNQ
jgi:hypothetical protein